MQLDEFFASMLRLSLWLMALVVIFVPLERLFAVQAHPIWRKGIVTDLCYYFISSLLPAAALSAPMAIVAWAAHQAVPAAFLDASANAPLWVRIPVTMVLGEVGYYWGHRWSHQIPLLWKFHSIHHSAERLDFLVNGRAHPVDMVFGRFCALVPVVALGFGGPAAKSGSQVVIAVTLFGTIWSFFIHSNLRWRFGPLEWLVSTPAFHHWHHTQRGPINRNYSSTLPWLDWIFGTFHLPNQWPESYGIEEPMPNTIWGQFLHPIVDPPPPVTAKSGTEGKEPNGSSPPIQPPLAEQEQSDPPTDPASP